MFMKKTSVFVALVSSALVATAASATDLNVDLTGKFSGELEYLNPGFQLKNQGVTFHGEGPVMLGGGVVSALDYALYDGGPAYATFENLPFLVKSVSFDLKRQTQGSICDIFVSPVVCIPYSKITANAYDTLGNSLGGVDTFQESTSLRFTSELGIGKIEWSGFAAGGKGFSVFYGGGSSLSNLRLSSAVPEPASWLMMLVGVGMVGAALRYRRKTTIQVSYR
jgi:hypothetical protein